MNSGDSYSPSGWIILHRKIKEHWIYPTKRMTRYEAWMHMLMTVNYEDKRVSLGNKLVNCGRGQSLLSVESWAKEFRWTRQMVRTFFNLLKNDAMINLENIQKTTRLTICNYDLYQQSLTIKKPAKQPPTNQHPTSTEPQLKEDKEDKEISYTRFSFEEFWQLYDKNRGKAKCEALWRNIREDDRAKIFNYLPRYKAAHEKQFRQDPERFLSGKRWGDEIIPPVTGKRNITNFPIYPTLTSDSNR